MKHYPPNRPLLQTFRGPGNCHWCQRWVQKRESAHVLGKGMGGARQIDHELNLCSLCRECHQSHHDGHEPSAEQLWDTVARREGVTAEYARDEVNRIRREE